VVKWTYFHKKGHSKIWSVKFLRKVIRKFGPSPQTRRQVSGQAYNWHIMFQKPSWALSFRLQALKDITWLQRRKQGGVWEVKTPHWLLGEDFF